MFYAKQLPLQNEYTIYIFLKSRQTSRKKNIHIFEQCQRVIKKTWATLSDILNRNTKTFFCSYHIFLQ